MAAEFHATADWSTNHGWQVAADDLRETAAVFEPQPAPDGPPTGH